MIIAGYIHISQKDFREGLSVYLHVTHRRVFMCALSCRDCLKVIIQRSSAPDAVEHRLMWSPHVPSPAEEEEQEICNIVLSHGNDVSIGYFPNYVHVVFDVIIHIHRLKSWTSMRYFLPMIVAGLSPEISCVVGVIPFLEHMRV